MMVMPGLKAGDFCQLVVQKKISQWGQRKSFAHKNIVLLHSGPSRKIRKAFPGAILDNFKLGSEQAKAFHAKILEQTPIGKWLISIDLKSYYSNVYRTQREIKQAEYDVWAYVSRKFMHAGFKEVVTAVCGADPRRVFRKHEIHEMVRASSPETINGRFIQPIKDIYKASGDYVAFREICRMELDMARTHAHKENTEDAWEDFRARLKFFRMECRETAITLKKIGQRNLVSVRAERSAFAVG